MSLTTRSLVLLLVVLVASGCSKVVIRSDLDPNLDLSSLHTFYVRKLPADDRGIDTKAHAEDVLAFLGNQIMVTAPGIMVGVGMGDHSPRHRTPRIDIKVTGRAVKASIGCGE